MVHLRQDTISRRVYGQLRAIESNGVHPMQRCAILLKKRDVQHVGITVVFLFPPLQKDR